MGDKARRFCLDVILIAGAAAVGIFLLKKLFFLAAPVGLGLLFSEAVRSSLRKLRPVSPPVRRALIVLVLMILFACLLLAAVLAAERVLRGVMALGENLEGAAETLGSWLRATASRAGKWLSGVLHRDVETAVAELFPALLTEGAKRLAQRLPEWVGSLAGSVPTLLVSLVLFLFSGYYFSCEWERARALFYRLCPEDLQGKTIRRRAGFLRALKRMIRGYGLLFLITFGELLAGFLVLGIPGAAGKALATALVDALPIFGCGTVLIPWGVILVLQKKTAQGIGMLALYLLILFARQFLEPRIVGRSMGLHPIASLVLMLGGLALFGVWGMFLVPLCAACLADGKRAPPAPAGG